MSSLSCWTERLKPWWQWLRATFSRRDVLFGLAMAAAVWGAMPTFWEAFTPPDFSRGWRQDCDRVLIYQGLRECPRFRDTLRWWTGTWVGKVPFWRPLTSLFFWAEWKLFGWENQDAWVLVHIVLYMMSAAIAFIVMEQVIGSTVAAAFGTLILTVPSPCLGGLYIWSTTAPGEAVGLWINTPDMLLAILVGITALFALRGHWLSVVAAAACASCKETGFMAFPAVLLLDYWRNREWQRWWLVLCMVGLLLTILKLWSVGYGFVLGSNKCVLTRVFTTLAPFPFLVLRLPMYRPFAILGIGVAGALLCKGYWRAVILGASMFCATTAAYAALISSNPEATWAWVGSWLIDRPLWTVGLPMTVWAYMVWKGFGADLVLACSLYALFAFPCALAPQVRPHAYYVATIFGAMAIAAVWRRAIARLVKTHG